MERGTTLFWALIVVLLGTAAFHGAKAERLRRELQTATATIATGDSVTLSKVLDGDTVLVTTSTGDTVTVRLVGVKAFDPNTRDEAGPIGQAAEQALARKLADRPIEVELAEPPKDSHGRTLATLLVNGEDAALALVREGMTLVYTRYPFPEMATYLKEQEVARAERRGLWADPRMVTRADGLAREWSTRRK